MGGDGAGHNRVDFETPGSNLSEENEIYYQQTIKRVKICDDEFLLEPSPE